MEKVTAKICMTKDVGINGNLFGGNMMAWTDEAAAVYAMKITGERNVVSFRFAEMLFRYPVREGEILDFYCGSLDRGKTSLSFEISARSGGREVFRTQCTYVVVDEQGRKKTIDWAAAEQKQ